MYRLPSTRHYKANYEGYIPEGAVNISICNISETEAGEVEGVSIPAGYTYNYADPTGGIMPRITINTLLAEFVVIAIYPNPNNKK